MPPSGFTTNQARQVPDFLESCWTALRSEGECLGLLPSDALAGEIRNIDAYLAASGQESLVAPVLLMIRRFYEFVRSEEPDSYDTAQELTKRVVASLRADLGGIHVPPAPNARVSNASVHRPSSSTLTEKTAQQQHAAGGATRRR